MRSILQRLSSSCTGWSRDTGVNQRESRPRALAMVRRLQAVDLVGRVGGEHHWARLGKLRYDVDCATAWSGRASAFLNERSMVLFGQDALTRTC